MPRRSLLLRVGPHLLVTACLSGCGGADSLHAKDASNPAIGVERRDNEIKHEACDLASKNVKVLDANADGRPEIITVFDNGRPYCRAADINMDGTIDVFAYYDAEGQLRRRESGFDRDAMPDEIATYEHGQIVRKERETNNDGKLDTWDTYENGKLVREERDSAGDGFINQWWTFPNPEHPECAVVVSDINADTKPDPESQVDLCGSDDAPGKPAPQKGPGNKPTAPAGSAAPATSAAPAASAAAPAAPLAPSAAPASPPSSAAPAAPKGPTP